MSPTPTVTITMNGAELRVAEASDPLELWQALRSFFGSRGRVMKGSANGYRFPETTNREVRAVAGLLDRVERRFARDDLNGQAAERKRWREGRDEVEALTKGADPDAVYAKNESFWTYYAKSLCVFLSAAAEVATHAQMWNDAWSDAWDGLPDRLWGAAEATPDVISAAVSATAELASDVVGASGRVVGAGLEAAGQGASRGLRALLGPYLVPALIGGAVLTVGLVVPRILPTHRGAS